MPEVINTFIIEHPQLWQYFLLPALIIMARLVDVSISTYRTILTIQGHKLTSAVLGAIEALIWLVVIAAILQSVSGWTSYLAYAVGFGAGIYLGMWVEEKLAQGHVVIELITHKKPDDFLEWLRGKNIRFTLLEPESNEGKSYMVFMPATRKQAEVIIPKIRKFHARAFYTIASLKKAAEVDAFVGDEVKPVGVHKFFAKRY